MSGISITFMLVLALVIMITLIVLLVLRFYRNLTGDEGYLMFSLPVKTSSLIASKALSALIWILLAAADIAAALLIISAFAVWSDPHLTISGIVSAFAESGNYINITVSDTAAGITMTFAVLLSAITRIYAAVSIGQQWSEHRILGSFIAYVVLGILTYAVSFVFGMPPYTSGGLGSWTGAVFLICCIAVYSIITWYFLDRRLNLE